MPITSATIANIAVTAASALLVGIGAVQLRHLLTGPSPNGLSLAVTDISAIISTGDTQTMGRDDSPVGILEFSDFECPFCARFANETFDALDLEFIRGGRLRYAAMNLPLEIHQFARKAAEAAECAGQQGKFWEMRHKLFSPPSQLKSSDLRDHAAQLGLNEDRFGVCLDGQMNVRIQQQMAVAANLEIRNTPTFVVGLWVAKDRLDAKKKITGAQSLDVFRQVINEVSVKPVQRRSS